MVITLFPKENGQPAGMTDLIFVPPSPRAGVRGWSTAAADP